MNTQLVLDPHKSPLWKRWAIPLGIFVLALIVRIPALGKFITTDEAIWLDSSQAFAGGLLFADYECDPMVGQEGRQFVANGLGCTYNLPHPGVTTTWGGSLGLLVYYWLAVRPTGVDIRTFLQSIDIASFDPTLIAPARLPLVVMAALFVSLFYVLLRRLLGGRIALLSTLLLTLHPFHIAHSRVLHHDALATTFMVLSLLTMIGYWLNGWKRRWLLVSAVMAGLAFLSKPVGWFMIPCAGVMGGMSLYYHRQCGQWRGWPDVWGLMRDGILWGVVAALTFVAFFPALWIIPAEVIHKSISDINRSVQAGHIRYFLGQVSSDPGPLFYPVGWLLRASPLEVLGLLALPVAAWRSFRPRCLLSMRQWIVSQPVLVALMLFLAMFLVFETSSDKKMVRYFLPAFPVIDVFVALGLTKLAQFTSHKWQKMSLSKLGTTFQWPKTRHTSRPASLWERFDPSYPLLIASIILIQATLALSHFPYYFTYYNPLLGGTRAAPRLISVGWGEGLELAAAYLNQKPDADQLKVNVWFWQSFAPYFRGKTRPFFSIGRAMNCDYLVFYQNQLQRQSPGPELQAYYLSHYSPEYVVHLKGVDYAWIYAVPVERRTNWELTNIFDKLILYGYRQEHTTPEALTIQFIWENKGISAEDGLWAALQHCEREAHPLCSEDIIWQPCALAPGFSPEEVQEVGTLVESVCELNTSDLVPGIYSLHVGLGPSPSNQVSGYRPESEDVVDLLAPYGELGIYIPKVGTPSLIPADEALDALATEMLPPGSLPLHVSYGDVVALIGYQVIPPSQQTNHTTTITLYWQALQDVQQPAIMVQDFQVRFELIAPGGNPVARTGYNLLGLTTIGDTWQSGQVLADLHQVSLPDNLPPGDYRLIVALTRADSGELVPVLDEATGLLTTDHIQLETTIVVQ